MDGATYDDDMDLIQALQDAHYTDDPAFENYLSRLIDRLTELRGGQA